MIVKISRSGTSSLFQGCGLKELNTTTGDNACAWQRKHHSLMAYLLVQICRTNGEKRKKRKKKGKKLKIGEYKVTTKLNTLEKNSQRKETLERNFQRKGTFGRGSP